MSLVVPKPLIDQAKRELGDAGALSAEEAAWAEEIMSFIRGNWAYGLGAEEGAEAGREEGLAQGRRRGLAEGRRQGVDEGRRRELRRALLDVLALRGVDPSPAGRAAIETCEDLGRLEQWYEQAKSAPANMLAARFE